ncbi:Uncharacterised protein [Mycobacteroides abscessus subsp. abscessus]|nr:Uncharacterised protein [Mycobacteroides abscessus subsp. abscessus]
MVGCTAGNAGGIFSTCRQVSVSASTSAVRARSSSRVAHRANDVPPEGNSTACPPWCCAQAMLKSSNRIRHDTASTARWWTINTKRFLPLSHRALSIEPVAGFSRDRAWRSASSESASTARRHARASTVPTSGISSAHSPSFSSARNRSVACLSSSACNTVTTSSSDTPSGACSTTVWLNSPTLPPSPCSQRMIGVATTGPVPASTTVASPSANTAT